MPEDAPMDVVYLRRTQPPAQVERVALIAGLIAGVLLAGLVGWLGFRTLQGQEPGAAEIRTAGEDDRLYRVRLERLELGRCEDGTDVDELHLEAKIRLV